MTVKEWAGKLNGIEYPADELDRFSKEMAEDGIIAAYGASDDLLEFCGVINDEVGAWDGTTVKIAAGEDGELKIFNEEENRETAEFNKMQIACMKKIVAIWCPHDEHNKAWASWHITAPDIEPFYYFDIMEDGELFCRGLLFEAKQAKDV
jgi:hypothetical protein